jgi:hypothetical protein
LHAPFGEPSFAREFRNISRYEKLGIPALKAAFFGERKVDGEVRAVLLTRALDGWDDLDSLLRRWSELGEAQHVAILQACGRLAQRLHGRRQVHGCFYPKHIFLRANGDGYQAQLIDLEKTVRPTGPGQGSGAITASSTRVERSAVAGASGRLSGSGSGQFADRQLADTSDCPAQP